MYFHLNYDSNQDKRNAALEKQESTLLWNRQLCAGDCKATVCIKIKDTAKF